VPQERRRPEHGNNRFGECVGMRGEALMKTTITMASTLLAAGVTVAQTVNFDRDPIGIPPADWTCGVTGRGTPRWTVESDPGAPSSPNVLVQSGSGDFPWCVRTGTLILDGFVEVKFKPIRGREDRAGGVVWRWKGGNNYYVARANALENNVSLYYTERGSRRTLKYVDAPVAADAWHVLRVEFKHTAIRVLFDGKAVIEFDDSHIAGPGAVGVWTKADSVTAFDDFSFGAVPVR
jgi:hypothetical protein